MQADRKLLVHGYFAKVEVRPRVPELWGWTLRQDGTESVTGQSADLFRHAEDAWKAGQAVLSSFAQCGRTARPASDEA